MPLNTKPLHDAIRFALATGLLAASATGVAYAQEPASDTQEAGDLDKVEVIGSRIRRAEGEQALPVFSLGREELEKTGLPVLADVIRELSVNGPSLSLQTNNGNTSGNSQVNLRNCGANRTLVLVNGRRWVSDNGLGGSVDLGSIPLSAVERIDVLKDGASALYGSDAICGVINVQTRQDFDGFQFDSYLGQYTEGDGTRQSYSITAGTTTDRFSGLLNVSYVKQDPVFAGDRDISAVPLFGFPANTSSPGRASGVTPFGSFTVGGVNYTLDPNRPGCQVNQLCSTSVATTDFRPFNFVTDGYNFAPENYLLQPQTIRSLFGTASYDLTDTIRFSTEVFYTNRNGDAQLAAQPLSPLTISATNVYNPFRANITGGGFRPTNFPRVFGQDQDTWRFAAGLDGTLDIADRTFYWDVGYSYADNRQIQLKDGFYFTTRVAQALGPSFIDGQGIARCGTAAAPIAGCVPLNVFGGANGITREMFDYISVVPRNVQESDLESITANLSGDLFELPAGPLSFALGLERRSESGSSQPDPLSNAGLVLGDNPVTPTEGSYSVDEAFLELQIPILADVPGAKALDVSLAARYSDYDTFGDTTTPKFSFRWQPFDQLLVRGSWGEGFRAPAIAELFQGNATGRPAFQDPCNRTNPLFIANQSIRDQCAATGVPANFLSQLSQTFLTTGGNVDLKPETSVSKTLGLVYSPSWAEGLEFTLDWYNLTIENAIGANGATTILNGCYQQLNPLFCAAITRDRTGAVNGNPGEISNIDSRNQNFLGGTETEGYDFSVAYRFSTENWGNFAFRWENTYVSYFGDVGQLRRGELNGDGNISAGNLVGSVANASSTGAPRHRLRSNLIASWNYGDFSFSSTLEYRSRVRESCTNVTLTAAALGPAFASLRNMCSDPDFLIDQYSFVPGSRNVRATPSVTPSNVLGGTTYVHVQGAWKAPWDATISLGVRNLFDRDPPFSSNAFANSFDAQYLIPGRYIYATYQHRF